jgi:hypothetical protein
MTKTLTLLHTSPVHIATFDRLLAEIAPHIPVRHIVDEALLNEARAAGTITPELAQRVATIVRTAFDDGAALVVCTCSTIGGCAEGVGEAAERMVLRIDRAMAERAVALGTRIVVVAALATTFAPTRVLLLNVARHMGKPIEVIEVVSSTAWTAFEAGDQARYLREIAATLRQAATRGDVIVLAQVSMARAAELCPEISVPILASPRLGRQQPRRRISPRIVANADRFSLTLENICANLTTTHGV